MDSIVDSIETETKAPEPETEVDAQLAQLRVAQGQLGKNGRQDMSFEEYLIKFKETLNAIFSLCKISLNWPQELRLDSVDCVGDWECKYKDVEWVQPYPSIKSLHIF